MRRGGVGWGGITCSRRPKNQQTAEKPAMFDGAGRNHPRPTEACSVGGSGGGRETMACCT